MLDRLAQLAGVDLKGMKEQAESLQSQFPPHFLMSTAASLVTKALIERAIAKGAPKDFCERLNLDKAKGDALYSLVLKSALARENEPNG